MQVARHFLHNDSAVDSTRFRVMLKVWVRWRKARVAVPWAGGVQLLVFACLLFLLLLFTVRKLDQVVVVVVPALVCFCNERTVSRDAAAAQRVCCP